MGVSLENMAPLLTNESYVVGRVGQDINEKFLYLTDYPFFVTDFAEAIED